MTVRWRGRQAEYNADERQIMASLTVREQHFVHTLKAFTQGQISETSSGETTSYPGSPQGNELDTHRAQEKDSAEGLALPVYTDPEDLEFGPKKKGRPVYALAWTWRKHKILKFKKHGERQLKVWKRWYERQGWKVVSLAGGYMASNGDQRHSIALHEYDKVTLERLR